MLPLHANVGDSRYGGSRLQGDGADLQAANRSHGHDIGQCDDAQIRGSRVCFKIMRKVASSKEAKMDENEVVAKAAGMVAARSCPLANRVRTPLLTQVPVGRKWTCRVLASMRLVAGGAFPSFGLLAHGCAFVAGSRTIRVTRCSLFGCSCLVLGAA